MQTFTKAERLSSKLGIDKLLGSGKSFNSTLFKVIWQETTGGTAPVQIVISVPKRLFKKAVDRNRLKRLTREAYRKNKNIVYDKLKNKKILVMFIYKVRTIVEYREMEEKVIDALKLLSEKFNS